VPYEICIGQSRLVQTYVEVFEYGKCASGGLQVGQIE
jgi:hypothetical protein